MAAGKLSSRALNSAHAPVAPLAASPAGSTLPHMPTQTLRNVAIVAHVDHGKTTLVDHMLRQAGTFRENEVVVERVMDSNDLERERGITILAKNTSVRYRDKSGQVTKI